MKQLDPRAVWLFFLPWFIVWGFNFIVLFIILLLVAMERPSDLSVFSVLLVISVIPLMVFLYIWARLSYHFYRYELTDLGFKKEHGVIFKKYTTIPYERIQNIDIRRGILARLLSLSDLYVQTAGSSYSQSPWIAEGRLPGLSVEEAERLREELLRRVQQPKDQGL